MIKLIKKNMNAIAEAYAGSLFVRSLLENQSDIIKANKLKKKEIHIITDRLMDIEIVKNQILLKFLSEGSLSINQLKKEFNFSDFQIVKYISILQNEGWLELRDISNKIYGIKPIITKNKDKLEIDLISPWNLRSVYDPIKIIVDANLCCLCGICKAVCPVDAITIPDNKPIIDENKCIHCGLCNYHCPRTSMPLNILKMYISNSQFNLFQDLKEQPIGPYKLIKSAQTSNDKIKEVCQDGGMVTTFLQYLFEKNEIDGAIVVKRKPNSWDTMPVIITNFDDILKASGTKYAISPNFIALDKSNEVECKKLAFVGTPCQVQAMRKYQVYSNIFEEIWGKIEYIIGIFCMESFPYENVIKISEELCETPINKVSKMDIDKGKFFVYDLDKNSKQIPIKEVTSLARHPCHYCLDLTNELSDITCGSIGSGPGWNTIIIRSEKGNNLYNNALKDNYFQIKDIIEDKPFGLPLIKKLSNIKRKGNFNNLIRILDDIPLSYYNSLKKIMRIEEK